MATTDPVRLTSDSRPPPIPVDAGRCGSAATSRVPQPRFSKGARALHKVIILVGTLATAAIHLLYIAPNFDGVVMGLCGLGYLALLALRYLPIPIARTHHRLVRRVLIVYVAVVFLGYFVYGLVTGEWSVPFGPLAKAIEVVLMVLLLREDRSDRAGQEGVHVGPVSQFD
jgi:hypothetical protein